MEDGDVREWQKQDTRGFAYKTSWEAITWEMWV
jgi:hypothetical protein